MGGAAPASKQFHGRPIVSVGANQSNNWSGYNQGALEQGGKTFSAISGQWTVPTATAHKPGENEYSSTWVGIGGATSRDLAMCIHPHPTLSETTGEAADTLHGLATHIYKRPREARAEGRGSRIEDRGSKVEE